MNQNSSIIFFSQLYYPDITTTAVIMTELAEDLASYGMNVKVICAQPTYLIKESCPKTEVRNRVSIRRVWTFLFDKNQLIGRILNSTSFFFGMLFTIFATTKNDLLVFNTNPALLPFIGTINAKLRGQKYIVLIHDLWPELPAHAGMIRKAGAFYKVIEFINVLSLKHARGIIVLSNAMRNLILPKVPEKKNDIHVIPNWADANRIFPVIRDKNRLIDELGLRHKKVVMYSGNLGRYQPLEVMILAANELQNRKDIKFVFAGNGGKKKKIQEMTSSMNLANVLFIPFQSMDRLAESLSLADISLMGIYPQNDGVIMPSKLYGLLAVGKPIICVSDPFSEVVEILEESGAGLHSAIDDPKELAQKIESIMDNPEEAKKMGHAGRTYFLENFERRKITAQWKDVLKKTLNLTPSIKDDLRIGDSHRRYDIYMREETSHSYNPISAQDTFR